MGLQIQVEGVADVTSHLNKLSSTISPVVNKAIASRTSELKNDTVEKQESQLVSHIQNTVERLVRK